MKKGWIVGLCLALAITGCAEEPEPEPVVEEEEVVEEELVEVELVEDMNNDTYTKVRTRIQDELRVFDASRFDEGLMMAVRDDVKSGMDIELVKEIVEETLSSYMNMWKREIVTENLDYLVGEYSRADFERLMQDTSNEQIKSMVVAYVVEKLKQEGYQFD